MKTAYSAYGIRRPHGYYGVITDSLAEQVKAAENAESMEMTEDTQSEPSGPVLSM